MNVICNSDNMRMKKYNGNSLCARKYHGPSCSPASFLTTHFLEYAIPFVLNFIAVSSLYQSMPCTNATGGGVTLAVVSV